MKPRTIPAVVAIAAALACDDSGAQTVFTSDLDDDAGWTIVQDFDASATFGFDYSELGIPPAPNGADTLGLRLAANLDFPEEAAAISATPDDVTFGGQYTVKVDFWLNYHVDPARVGTTEFIGAFVGFDASAGAPFNGAGFLGDSDGDTSRDYRLYKDATEQFIDSGQYDISSQNNSTPDLQFQFPGRAPPAEQTDPGIFDPPNSPGTAPDGTLAFAWHTLRIDVDTAGATASFRIDGFPIGTIDGNLGAPVETTGAIALTFTDLFGSVSTNPQFSFGVFDNLVVTQFATRPRFRRGDCNADGPLDIADPVANLFHQFLGGDPPPPCLDACDFDDSGLLEVTDPIGSLAHQFLGGTPPPAPGKEVCGSDPTDDATGCESFAPCDGGG